ncbi:uncharacterized protein [Euphorbia lathyris]|uniref:uncharacterized protein n=1 Tax=Euphorbia lathyris TaxID=212925 RepID=UPI0033130CD1
MAKKTMAEKQKRKKLISIDNVPTFSKQPRSPAPKRRSDFSSFFSSTSISISGSFRHGFSTVTMTGSDDTKVEEALSVVLQCRRFANRRAKKLSKLYKAPVEGIESVSQSRILDHCGSSEETIATENDAMPGEARVTESSSVCATPGNVVWAKTDCQMWWPAEIIGETSSIADSRSQGICGHVLVQFYGNHGSAWVDPARDLSQLENCFEERSCNTMEKFQDALKQALKRKEDLSSYGPLGRSVDESSHPSQQDEPCDKCTSSISSRTESDVLERRKSKRIRKHKLRFADVVFPLKSATKVRRLRIMRYLGLTPPVGSPF